MNRKSSAPRDPSALASRVRRQRASTLHACIKPCIEQLESRTLLSALPTSFDTPTDPASPALLATAATSDLHPVISGEGTIVQDTPYALNLSATGSIRSWTIDWGDGVVETIDGNPSSATHTYTTTGSFTISAYATAADGTHQAVSPQLNTPVLVGIFSEPSTIFEYKGLKYFTADQNDIPALWRTDGTEAGTYPIKTLTTELPFLAPFDSTRTKFYNLGDRMVLVTTPEEDVSDPLRPSRTAVWTSDGTAAGTSMLDQVDRRGSSVIVLGSKILYSAEDCYKITDGVTAASLDFLPDPITVSSNWVVANNTLYYIRWAAADRNELWKSDGTPEGTMLLKGDLPRGGLGSLVDVDGKVYFTYSDTQSFSQLWVTDGTPEGTALLESKPHPAHFQQLLAVNHTLLYATWDGSRRLFWKTDGTANGAVLLKDGIVPSSPTLIHNGSLYFIISDAEDGSELWKTDGTPAGTKRLKNLNLGGPVDVEHMVGVGDVVYISTKRTFPYTDTALWKTDGTEAGTVSIPGMPLASIRGMQASNDAVVIRTDSDIYVYRDWQSDAVTQLTNPITTHVTAESRLFSVGNMLFLTTKSISGTELWCSGGDGPQKIRVVSSVGTSDLGQPVHEGSAYTLLLAYHGVAADSIRSWTIDWGDGSTQTVEGHPSSITHTYVDDGSYTIHASASDGTHTYAAADTIATIRNVSPTLSISGNNKATVDRPYQLSLAASDPGNDHIRSWTIDWGDGVVETIEGNPSSATHTYATAGSFIVSAYATDEDGASAKFLYNAAPVANMPTDSSANIHEFTSPGGIRYYCRINDNDPFIQGTTLQAWELWRDGANGGSPVLLHTFYAEDLDQFSYSRTDTLPPAEFTFVGETLFFAADSLDHGRELWATNNTATSAWMVKDLCLGTHEHRTMGIAYTHPNGSSPDDLMSYNGRLYFLAFDGVTRSLWQTDGETVTKADDILAKLGARPTNLLVLDGALILTTQDDQQQLEFYRMDSSGAISPLIATHPRWTSSSEIDVVLVDGQVYFKTSKPLSNYPYYEYQPWVITGGPVRITVTDPNPLISMTGEATVAEGSAYILNLGYFDLDPAAVHSVSIDWGDGHSETVTGGPSSVSHTYADGPYTANVTLSWKDETGEHAMVAGHAVSVQNVEPTLALGGSGTVQAGKEYVLTLGSSDPGQDVITLWRIDWGDGRIEKIKGNPSRVTHRYKAAGDYTISASAVDSDGRYFASSRVTVTPPLGSITGWVFNDVSGEGVWDRREKGLAGWYVFLDGNRNGRLDRQEAWAITDKRGRYFFEDLAVGSYRVQVKAPSGWRISSPIGGGDVTVAEDQVLTQTFAVTQKALPSKPAFSAGHSILDAVRRKKG